jgi:hypothetical protein
MTLMLALIPKRITMTLLVVLAAVSPTIATAQADDASKHVQLQLEGFCDKVNNKLWLANSHASRTIIVTARWNLSGSKRLITDKFQVLAGTRREIGCAAQADLVSAEFSQE